MLLLHIGRGKAGSTTIQRSVLSNEKLLRRHNIIVPEVSMKHGGNYAPLAWALWAKSSTNSPDLDEFSALLDRNRDRTVFVSSEFLFDLRPDAIAAIHHFARGHDVKIISYLREYPAWFQSLYSQATRKGANVDDFDKYFDRNWKRASAFESLNNWANVFGWENVRLRSLDSSSLTGGTLLDDLSAVLGVTISESPDQNKSPNWVELEFIRELYNRFPQFRKNDAVRRDLRLTFGRLRACLDAAPVKEARYLKPDQWSLLANLYAKDAALIAEKVGVKIPLRDTSPPPERPFLPLLNHAPKSICTRFFNPGKGGNSFWEDRAPIVRDAVASVVDVWSGDASLYYNASQMSVRSGGLASL